MRAPLSRGAGPHGALVAVGLVALALVEGVVDRIDGPVVHVETGPGQVLRVARRALPAPLREGDVLRRGRVDGRATRARAAQARALLRRLRSKPSGAGAARRRPQGAVGTASPARTSR